MKNIVVIGGTSGIGLEVVKLFSKENNVFVVGRNNKDIEHLENVSFYFADLNNIKSLKNACLNILNKTNTIDILVNCAGIFQLKSVEDIEIDDYDQIFNVNIRAPIFTTKIFLKSLKNCKSGSYIFNVGSSSCYNGGKLTSLYCASKHALLGFSKSISEELKEHKIRVCNISPSSTKTKMGKLPLASKQDYETFIDPKEVAEVLSFISKFNDNMEIKEILLNRVHIQ